MTTPYRPGGLMRCCIETIKEHGPGVEGQTMQCKYHEDETPSLRYRDGAWEWNWTIGQERERA